MIHNIIEDLKQNVLKEQIYTDESMKKHTSFKIGGNADYFVKVKTVEELIGTIKVAKKNNLNIEIIGNGTNLLVKDRGIRGIVVKLELDKIEKIDNGFIVEAGVPIIKVSQLAAKQGLTGLEFACGIPGTVGGAVKMNAGAYGGQMSDIVAETTYLNEDLDIKTITNSEHEFKYRETIFDNKKWIIISTKLILKEGKTDIIKKKMEDNLEKRKKSQPLNFPNAGSVFKRGEDFFTAELIDKSNLKGYNIGDAFVSEKHAGFIINKGNATANDVIELIEYIKKEVKQKFNKSIDTEIKIIGE